MMLMKMNAVSLVLDDNNKVNILASLLSLSRTIKNLNIHIHLMKPNILSKSFYFHFLLFWFLPLFCFQNKYNNLSEVIFWQYF